MCVRVYIELHTCVHVGESMWFLNRVFLLKNVTIVTFTYTSSILVMFANTLVIS